MAKAHITTKEGALITIEGTPAEVAAITEKLGGAMAPSLQKGSKHRQSKLKPTPMGLLGSLIDGNFFKKPKDLAAVKVALEEMGHIYPMTTLSPILLRLVRKHQLRRIKEKNRWFYAG